MYSSVPCTGGYHLVRPRVAGGIGYVATAGEAIQYCSFLGANDVALEASRMPRTLQRRQQCGYTPLRCCTALPAVYRNAPPCRTYQKCRPSLQSKIWHGAMETELEQAGMATREAPRMPKLREICPMHSHLHFLCVVVGVC